jgi:hypothetical protein
VRELTYFPLPEHYPMTSGYGYRVDPITGAQSSFHRGVDYGAPHGTAVLAPFDGQVTTGYESGAGNWSWVVNGPDMFKSFHHASFAVTGGWVGAGTTIAAIDSTGSSTGSHAHFELWEGGVNIDPTGYLTRAPLLEPEDVMNEEDWNRMQHMLDETINRVLSSNYTGARALQAHGDPGVFEIVIKDGQVMRRHIPNPDQIGMLQWTDHLAGSGGTPVRVITNDAYRREFLALPVVDE